MWRERLSRDDPSNEDGVRGLLRGGERHPARRGVPSLIDQTSPRRPSGSRARAPGRKIVKGGPLRGRRCSSPAPRRRFNLKALGRVPPNDWVMSDMTGGESLRTLRDGLVGAGAGRFKPVRTAAGALGGGEEGADAPARTVEVRLHCSRLRTRSQRLAQRRAAMARKSRAARRKRRVLPYPELALHSVESGDGDRLLALALSEGSMTTLLEAGVAEEEGGLDRLRAAAAKMPAPAPWWIGYPFGSAKSNRANDDSIRARCGRGGHQRRAHERRTAR
jgi:hypothetical protein